MVSSNRILTLVATLAGIVPVVRAGGLIEAALQPDIVVYNPIARRASTVDPYAGWTCAPRYTLIALPAQPSCTQNNCWRAFLNARKGPAAHCPSTAFEYCCQWYALNDAERPYVVKTGIFYHFVPWSANCGAAGPFVTDAQVDDVVKDINNVCACTLNHQVKVALPNDYAALSALGVRDPACAQHL